MLPGLILKRVVSDRLAWVEKMVAEIRELPLSSLDAFLADRRNLWAAESCLRRALEALFDLGRHILAKGFNVGVSEYKEIATELDRVGVLPSPTAQVLRTLAGYRNRLVHFYHEVSEEEIYEVCSTHLDDVEHLMEAYRHWLQTHPDAIDETL